MGASGGFRWVAGMVGAAVVAAVAVMSGAVAVGAAPAPPQSDPFYRPPAGYESTAPGTVLRWREMPVAAFATLPQKVHSWQLLYRSTDALGKPEATVTTLLMPYGFKPDSSRPLLSYQVAEDSPAPQCAISYQLRLGAGNENAVSQAEILLIDAAVRKGWAVSVPDYEGPMSAYTAGIQAGQAVLDGIRAVQHFAPAGLAGKNTPVGMWGYSGGALASGWASELQPAYAPELNVKGVAEGGLPVNVETVLKKINGGPFSGIAIGGIVGLSQAYPDLAAFIQQNATDEGKAAFAKAATQCNQQNASMFAFRDMYKYFKIADPLHQPVPQRVLAENTMGRHTPTAPLFVYHSTNDELIPPADVDTLVRKFCADGARIAYQRDIASEHVALVITGSADALNWLDDRLDGKPAGTGCTTRTVASSLLTPKALATFGSVLLHDLLALLGAPIRPTDMA